MVNETEAKTLHIPSTATELPSNWIWKRLDDVCEGIFDCPHSTPKLTSDSPLLARSQDIRSGVFRLEEAARVSEETYLERIKRAEPIYGDLLYSREGTYFGIAAEVPKNVRVCLGQRMVLLRPASKILNFRFLRYWLNSPTLTSHIYGHRDGTVAERLNLPTIRGLPVPIPPLPEQRAIAHILGTLDDKIELNQQMNRTLEAIARAIFKSWFADFDPVRAKMDGRQPAGMDAATADLFPGEFEDSPLGMIPKGWNTIPLEDLFFIPLRNGLTKPKRVRGLGTYMVNMGELFAYRRIGDIEMDRVPLTESEAEKNLLQTGDLLFARQSLTWEGAGQCSIVTEAKEPRTFESHLIRCRLNPEKAVSWYYFYYFWSNEGRGRIVSLIEQVAAAGIRGSDLAKLTVLTPPIKIQRCFGVLVEPLEKKMASNDTESRTLASIRDALLPKLLSGEIRVKEAERLVEAAA